MTARRLLKGTGTLLVALVVLASCGIPEDSNPTALPEATPTPIGEAPTTTPNTTQAFTIYLSDGQGKVRPAKRQVGNLTVHALLDELREVPTEEEIEQGLVSLIPQEATLLNVPDTDSAGLTILDFASGSIDTLGDTTLQIALAQIVFTLTMSPDINSVLIRIDGRRQSWPTDVGDLRLLTRDDFPSRDPEIVEPTPAPADEEPPTEEESTPEPNALSTPSGDN